MKLNALEIILSENPELRSHPAWEPFCARFKGREGELECSPVRSAWLNYRNGWDARCVVTHRLEAQNKLLTDFVGNLSINDECAACRACESNLINRDLLREEISKIA